MPSPAIDLRSDSVTKPTQAMRAAIAAAVVGDDVFNDGPILGEDPTVNELQQTIADLLGKEAALFVPSGTMSNQIAVRVHCRPGDEFICEAGCHVFNYEQGGYAQLSGVCPKLSFTTMISLLDHGNRYSNIESLVFGFLVISLTINRQYTVHVLVFHPRNVCKLMLVHFLQ